MNIRYPIYEGVYRILTIIFRCKDSMQTGTTLEVLTNGTAVQSSFIEPSGFAYGQK